nr:receptor-like protein 12 [Quercus suber]
MKSLEHLNLANCNLIGSISTSLGNLTKLTILDLSYNSFSGLLPLSLYNLPNLSSLYLDNNQLVGPLPNHENINFFHGPQRHKTPFFAKLLGIVAVEVIGSRLLPPMFQNISVTSMLLNRSRPLRLTQRSYFSLS